MMQFVIVIGVFLGFLVVFSLIEEWSSKRATRTYNFRERADQLSQQYYGIKYDDLIDGRKDIIREIYERELNEKGIPLFYAPIDIKDGYSIMWEIGGGNSIIYDENGEEIWRGPVVPAKK